MTHSSHSARDRAIHARNYEAALSELILEEKTHLSNMDKNDPLFAAKFTPLFALLMTLEAFRNELLHGSDLLSDDDRRDVDRLVQPRMNEQRGTQDPES